MSPIISANRTYPLSPTSDLSPFPYLIPFPLPGDRGHARLFTRRLRRLGSQELAVRPFDPKTFEIGTATSVEEAESDHLVQTKVVPAPVPFGYLHDDWVKMRQQIEDGDELKYFRTISETASPWFDPEASCIGSVAEFPVTRNGRSLRLPLPQLVALSKVVT